jgi:hypothetical protein
MILKKMKLYSEQPEKITKYDLGFLIQSKQSKKMNKFLFCTLKNFRYLSIKYYTNNRAQIISFNLQCINI